MNLLRPQYDDLLTKQPTFRKAKKWDTKEWLPWTLIIVFISFIGFYFGYIVPQQRLERINQSITRLKGIAANYHQETLNVLKFANVYIEAYKAGKLEEIPSLAMKYQQRQVSRPVYNGNLEEYKAEVANFEKASKENKNLKLADIAALLAQDSQNLIDNFPSYDRKMQEILKQYKIWEDAQKLINLTESQLTIFTAEQADLQEALKINRKTIMSFIVGGPSDTPKLVEESPELALAILIEEPNLKPSFVSNQALLDAVKQVEKSKAILAEAQEFFNQLKDQWKLIFPKQAEPIALPMQQNNTIPTVTTPTKPTLTPEQQRQEAERLRIEAEKRAAEQKRLEEQRQREIEQQKANEALCKSGLSSNCPPRR